MRVRFIDTDKARMLRGSLRIRALLGRVREALLIEAKAVSTSICDSEVEYFSHQTHL